MECAKKVFNEYQVVNKKPYVIALWYDLGWNVVQETISLNKSFQRRCWDLLHLCSVILNMCEG